MMRDEIAEWADTYEAWARAQLGKLPKACQARADMVRRLASSNGVTGQATSGLTSLAWRIAWDAPAAGEYPRLMLSDGVDVERLRPDMADEAWHHIAGATILGPYCCQTPAAHRDALGELAKRIRTEGEAS